MPLFGDRCSRAKAIQFVGASVNAGWYADN